MENDQLIANTIHDVVNAYIGQFLWSAGLAVVLYYFYSLYKRRHLKIWAFSWFAFSLYTVFASLSLWLTQNGAEAKFIESIFTFLYTVSSMLQVFWLLYGSYFLLSSKEISLKTEFGLYGLIIVLGLASSLLYLYDESDNYMLSTVLPLGFKSIITGFGFLLSGIMIMRIPGRDMGMGKKLLWIAFCLFGLIHLHYFYKCISILQFPQQMNDFGFFLGVIDLVLLAFIGIGMVIWLLEQERAALLKTNRELDSFLYSTSHDLRAPVASLLGLINLAKIDVKEKESQHYISMMEERVHKLDDIFSDILNYSRNIKTEINLRVIRLGQLVDDVISDVKFNEGADSIRLDYEEQLHHILRTDYYQLKVILSNLISNAVKYHDSTKADQYIAIRFEQVDSVVQISVKDNGIGIARESQPKVFDMFYRASSEAEGSGLGLFIVKQALEKINATISLHSVLGEGSVFTITLPDAAVKQ